MPVALDLVAMLTALLICIVCYMLLVAYRATLGALLQALASGLHQIGVWGVHPFSFLASGASWVDQQINNALATAVKGTEWALARMLHYTALLIQKTYESLADLGEATYNAIAHTVENVIPSLINAATVPLHRAIQSLDHQLGYLWRVVTNLAHEVSHLPTTASRPLQITIKRYIEPAVKAAAVSIPTRIPIPIPRIGSIERTLHGIDETLKDTLRKVTPAALAGLIVGSVLSTIGMSWLRCRNVRSAGRALCGMNINALEGLLAGLVTIFGTFSIVAFAEELQPLTQEGIDAVRHFWRADVIGAGSNPALGESGFSGGLSSALSGIGGNPGIGSSGA